VGQNAKGKEPLGGKKKKRLGGKASKTELAEGQGLKKSNKVTLLV